MTLPKTRLADLALLGGSRAFPGTLYVGRPNLGDRRRLHERLDEILDRRWLTNQGPCVLEFEERLAALAGVPHCLAVCNATVGLEILLRATELRGEVIVPSFTFIATVHALHTVGLTPVFCDVDPATHSLDHRRVAELITPRTAGILAVHLWGRAAAVDELTVLAERHGLTLLFDAAHALHASSHGRPVGGFGRAEVFSFHGTKFVNSFEGGAITTHDAALAERLRLHRNFGFAGYDHVVSPGTNGKMSEIAAAMGLTSLDAMPDFVGVNARNYAAYQAGLANLPGLELFPYDPAERNNYQYVVLTLDAARTGLSRDLLVRALQAENVLARRYFHPGCHRMEPYRTLQPRAGGTLPVTERLADSVFALPTGTAVDPAAIAALCDLLRFLLAHGPALTAAAPPAP